MTEDESIDQVKFAIGRYDQLYESVNTKGNLYLALNALLIGGLATSYPVLDQKLHFSFNHNLVITAVILLCTASLISTIAAINPFTRPGRQKSGTSFLFFGNVAQHKCDAFTKQFKKRTKDLHLQDMLEQMHVLAQGLCMKYSRLKWAGWLLTFAMITLVIATVYLIFK